MFLLKLDPYSTKYILTSLNQFRKDMAKYAVAVGRKIGVFDSWKECQIQIQGYPNAKYKKFNTQDDAENFIKKFSLLKSEKDECILIEDDITACKLDKDIDSLLECTAPLFKNSGTLNDSNDSPVITSVKTIEKDNVDGWNYQAHNYQLHPIPEIIMNKITSIEHKLSSFTAEVNSKLDHIIENLMTKRKASADEGTRKKPKLEPAEQGDLIINENGLVVVYTDGACSRNGQVGAKAGIGVWFNHNHPLNVSAPVKGPPTNNTAEIQAARLAITQAEKAMIQKLSVHTDSKFVISCITEWIYKWKKNNWKLSDGGPVKNKDELIKLDNAIKKLKVVEWNYVAGHKGIMGNEMADKLARAGAEEYRSNLTFGRDSQDFED